MLPAGEVTWADPLTMLVSHERKHWRKAARGRLSRAGSETLEGRILLAPTLLPVYRAEDAAAAISRIPGLTDQYPGEPPDVAVLLRDLYPPAGTSALRWWSPLPLDRLGETLLAQVLMDPPDGQSADDYLLAMLGAADLPQAAPGLTLMARLSADPQTSGVLAARISHCLGTLVSADRFRLLPALLLADRLVAPESRTSERHLASLNVADILTLVQNITRAPAHRMLQEAGLQLLDYADRILDTDEMRAAGLPEELRGMVPLMRALGADVDTLGHVHATAMRAQLLLQLGRAGEAVGPAESAARSMRAIFRASSAQGSGPRLLMGDKMAVHATGASDQSESLLAVLDVYAQVLKAVGRLQESAEVRRECAAVAGKAAVSANPGAKRTAAIHMYKLAELLLELDQADQAELWTRDAVQLAHALPVSLLTAEVVTLWARTLERSGRQADARAIAAEALRLHREIASETSSRTHLAVAMQALQHLVPQRDGRPDPLTELREEVLRDPALAMPALVGAAAQRAQQLAEQGQADEARVQMAEAIAQARRLAADDPDYYLEFLAAELTLSAHRGLSADPAGAAAEAVAIIRRLVDEHDRSDLRMGLAVCIEQHSLLLRAQGRDKDALRGFAEAIGLLRPLLALDRWQTAVHLSVILGLFSETARKHGDIEQAVAAAREAIDLEVARTDDITPAPAERLLLLRRMLFVALAGLMGSRAEQGADPAVIIAIASEIGGLARSFPAETLDDGEITIFAGALCTTGTILRDSGRAEDALPPLNEAISTLRARAEANPTEPNTGLLFRAGTTRASAYHALGRHAEAAHAIAEALTDCRRPLEGGEQERRDCLYLAGCILDELRRRPEFAADALALAIEMSRTTRELPIDRYFADSRGAVAAGVIMIHTFLMKAVHNGLKGDEQRAAALEISASTRFLMEQAPDLLDEVGHVHALTLAAGILGENGDLDQALEMNTYAVELQRKLTAKQDGNSPGPDAGILVLKGLLLSGKGRHEDAIHPLEQALPILLAAGQGISADQVRLLNMTITLLSNAYKILKRDDAMRSMIDAVNAAGLPDSVPEDGQGFTKPDRDLLNALRTAEEAAKADPERGITELRKVLDAAVKRDNYVIAYAACRRLAEGLRDRQFTEALPLADLQIAYGRKADIGPWTQLYDKCQHLETRSGAGLGDQSILTETADLLAQAEHLPEASASLEFSESWWVRESLMRAGTEAALRLNLWPQALHSIQAEVASLRDRGAPEPDVAGAELNAYSALVAMERIPEATELLDRCEAAFRREHSSQHRHLGLVAGAQAQLAALAGDLTRAVRLQSEAFDWLYRSGESIQIQTAHSNFASWLKEADPFSAHVLAHSLAAALIAELSGRAADIEPITGGLFLRAGDSPSTLDLLCAAVDETPGTRFGELLDKLSRGAPAAPGQALSRLLHQARAAQHAVFDELSRQRMEWDPVFAGIVAARHGDIAAARAVQQRLPDYAENPSWSKFSHALAEVLHQRPVAGTAMTLDIVDQVFFRRCMDALDGNVHISPELVHAIPIAGLLSRFLHAVQSNEPSAVLARTLEKLAEERKWQQLVSPLRKILTGDRDPQMVFGLDPDNTAIISTLLGHLAAP